MIMPSKDNLYNGKKGIGFENPSYFEKAKDLRPTLYDEKVIGLGYTPMFLTHSDEALEIEKFKRSKENKIEFAYDYGNLNARDVNDALGYKKKAVAVHSDPLALVAEKTNVSKRKEKVVVSSDSEGSGSDDFSELKKITALLAKAFNRRKFYSKATNNNLRTSSTSQSANKKQEFVKTDDKKVEKKADEKKSDEQVLLAEDLAWMGSSSDSDQEINANMVFMAQIKKVLSESDESSSSAEETIAERYVLVVVDYYSRYTWVFFLHSKDEASEVIISFIKKTQVNLQLQVQRVRTDNGTEFKNKTLAKFFDEKAKGKWGIGVLVGYSKESAAFRIHNKRTRKIHESVNVNFDELSEMASKQFSLEPGLYNLNETRKSSNPSVSQVLETSKKDLEDLFHNFYDEYFDSSKIMKSSTTNVETSNAEIPLHEEEVFHESFESFQEESSSSSLNDDVQQSSEEVRVPSSNTQSISNNMIPNVDEASTSHNVFNKRLEDAYFDASTSFHDPSNVHTFYQPYPHEKKWTKDHPLHKIIGDPKSSVRTRGQLANSCLFSCSLSSIEPTNVAEALRDVDWVSAMQEELDQFARLKDFTVYQMDVKTVFLNGILKEKVYVGQPLAPRAWYDVLSKFLIDIGFQKGLIDTTLFIKKKGKRIMLIQIYVDDIIFGSTNPKYCTKFSDLMVKRFEMSMTGEMKFFLGLQVNQFSNGIFINQSKYILDILKRFGMENCDSVPTPMVEQAKLKPDLVGKLVDHIDYRSMIGSLMYVTSSRPDIMFATCMCARYQVNPNEHHVSAVKRIFRYLKGTGTINLGLWYPKDSGFDLTGYLDAYHAGCHLDRKSTSGSVQFLDDKLVCWSSKKQNCVSISTAESKYIAVSSCCAQVLWMRTQLTDYGFFYDKVPIYYDSMSAIAISCNSVQHTRTKHIDLRHHFINDHVEKGTIELYFVGTEYQLADLFTKSLPEARFKFLVKK
nr:retrovirus-related Pol polyprotein from transposon TNT 1-94 [Tanacetum cinerariifolium]